MNKNIANTQTARYPTRIRRGKGLILVSAITFLTLGVCLGPNMALFLILVVALLVGWVALCRRYPRAEWTLTDGFLRGLLGR